MDLVQVYLIVVTAIAAFLLLLALIVPAVQLKSGSRTPEQAGESRTAMFKALGRFCFWAYLGVFAIVVLILVKAAKNSK